MGLWYRAKLDVLCFEIYIFIYLLFNFFSLPEICFGITLFFSFVPPEINVYVNSVYFEGLFLRNGDKDAKIFPHIRFRLPSPHLYLAPVLTFPSGRSTALRDYWQPSSCSPALFYLSVLFSLAASSFSLPIFLSTCSCGAKKHVLPLTNSEKFILTLCKTCMTLQLFMAQCSALFVSAAT